MFGLFKSNEDRNLDKNIKKFYLAQKYLESNNMWLVASTEWEKHQNRANESYEYLSNISREKLGLLGGGRELPFHEKIYVDQALEILFESGPKKYNEYCKENKSW